MGVEAAPQFYGGRVWAVLTRSVIRSSRPAYVAVAYFGKGAHRLLPLRRGSYLVVDASDAAVMSGQTHPQSLAALLKKGVRIYSSDGLHAKTFVLGSVAFVGSSNASKNSQTALIEAIIGTRDKHAVAAARQFVRERCHHLVGPEELKRLDKIYRPPSAILKNSLAKTSSSSLRIVRLSPYDLPESREPIYLRNKNAAERRLAKATHKLYDFYWGSKHEFLDSQRVLLVDTESNGTTYVSPPGTIVRIARFQDGLRLPTMIFVEMQRRRRIKMSGLIRRVGRQYSRKLKLGRVIRDPTLIGLIHDAFSP